MWDPKVHYYDQKRSPLNPILKKTNPGNILIAFMFAVNILYTFLVFLTRAALLSAYVYGYTNIVEGHAVA
jgi:hypothetical protein